MIRLLKQLYWDLKRRSGRYQFLQAILIGVPGKFGQEIRWYFYRKYFGRTGGKPVIHQDVRIRNIQNLYLGKNVRIGESNVIQAAGGVELGNNVLLGPGVKIWTANHKFDDPTKPISEQGYEYKKVVIGDDVWIGANAFIMPGANIGNGVIISAGAVVGGKAIPPNKILAGNPARIIGSREPNETTGRNSEGSQPNSEGSE
jgi:maltose O-acetyltransferase